MFISELWNSKKLKTGDIKSVVEANSKVLQLTTANCSQMSARSPAATVDDTENPQDIDFDIVHNTADGELLCS